MTKDYWRIMDKCPYCDRVFHKPKSIDSKLKVEKLDFHIKCPECDAVFQRLICFREGWVVKPPPVGMEVSDNPDGWKYWLDHLRGF